MILILLGLLSVWQQLPGPAGANCRAITIKPDDPRIMLCCTWSGSRGGLYRSTDSGKSWSPVQGIDRLRGTGMSTVRFCPTDPAIAICGTTSAGANAQYLSTDAGLTWSPTGYTAGYTRDITWPSGARDTFYVVSGLGLEKTTDLGRTWSRVFGQTMCWRAGFKPGSPDTVFVVGLSGLYRSFDRGATWDTTQFGRRAYDFCFDPVAPDTMYIAGHEFGVFKVWARGDSFESLGNAGRYNTSIAFDSARREIWTGGFAAFPIPGGISLSPDLGRTWRHFGPNRLPDPVCNDLALADTLLLAAGEYFGPQRYSRPDSTWYPSAAGIQEANIRAIATGPRVIYAAGSTIGVMRSTDHGQTWTGSARSRVSGRVHNTEMLPPGLVCSPTNPDTVYACFEGQQPYLDTVFRSSDGGENWFGHHVPELRDGDRLRNLALHPLGSETLYLASSRGVYRSGNSGRDWSRVDTAASHCVAADRHSPATVYSGELGRVRRSTDGGRTWHDFSTGLPQWSEAVDIAPDPDSAGVLFAALCGGEARDPLSGIYGFRPEAGFWSRLAAVLPGGFLLRPRITVEPGRGRLWCLLPVQGARVYHSTDRGQSWSAADSGLEAFRADFIHAADRVYLGTHADGLWFRADAAGIVTEPEPIPTQAPARFARTIFATGLLDLPDGNHKLLDHAGRMVLSVRARLDARQLPPGVYFLILPDGVRKIVRLP